MKMSKTINNIVFIFIVLSIICGYSLSYGQTDMTISERVRAKDLEGNLNLLNYWGEQPDYIQDFYSITFNLLSEHHQTSYADITGNKEYLEKAREFGITHLGGPMLGNITNNGVDIWLRTIKPASVEVEVEMPRAKGDKKIFGPERSTPETDNSVIIPVRGLNGGRTYSYRVKVNGEPIQNSYEGHITTTPDDDENTITKIAVGTCYHRWGLGNMRLAETIISRKPAALLLGGDIAVQDRKNNTGMHRADYLLRDFYPAWKKLVASVPVYATWDDHDYFGNDLFNVPKGFSKEDKEAVWKVFRYSWNNPSFGFGEKGKGVFFRTRIGPADIIMLDNRYFREKGAYLGKEQMKWLEEQLLDCKGPFIILSNGTMWSDYVSDGKDSWGVFDPEGREKIFNLIEKNHIGGVLLISGDRHGARGFRIPRPSGYNFYEFETGSLGGRFGPPTTRSEWDTQLYGLSDEYAFGEFTFNPTKPDPEVTFRLIRENGIVYYEITLTRSELTP